MEPVMLDYREAPSTEVDRPRGTVHGRQGGEDVGFLEYPDAPGSPAQQRLLEAVAEADEVVAMVDGTLVLRMYQGDRRGRLALRSAIDAMVGCLLVSEARIVFAITEWDVLDRLHAEKDARLRVVHTLLMAFDGFRDLVNIYSADRTVRVTAALASQAGCGQTRLMTMTKAAR